MIITRAVQRSPTTKTILEQPCLNPARVVIPAWCGDPRGVFAGMPVNEAPRAQPHLYLLP